MGFEELKGLCVVEHQLPKAETFTSWKKKTNRNKLCNNRTYQVNETEEKMNEK